MPIKKPRKLRQIKGETDMNILDIIAIEGIVIRKIPVHSTSLYSYREGDENRLKENESIVERGNRKYRQEIKTNGLGGKYLISMKMDQYSTVIFNNKYDGVGDTIESAYADYLKKKGVA